MIIPFNSAPQPKATTAVQSRVPRSAVVADQFTSSCGGVEGHARSTERDSKGLIGNEKPKDQGERSIPSAVVGIKPGPREAISDPIAFNAALHARGQTILTSGASQGTQSGRALDAGRGASTGIAGCDVKGFMPASPAVVVLSLVLALLASAPIICIGIVRLCA